MELRPCTACDRHVASEASTCPFCAARLVPASPRTFSTGRLSRAAAFAGAALAGCYTGTPSPQPPPPPDQQPVEQQPVDPQGPTFAKPPAAATGTIRGTVTDDRGNPLAGVVVQADLVTSDRMNKNTTTDERGSYVFANLAPGPYSIRVPYVANPRAGAPRASVDLAAGKTERADFRIVPYTPSNIPAPYGAPPARHRVV